MEKDKSKIKNKLTNKLILLVCCNLFDLMATLFWVGSSLTSEANPFMRLLINFHPVLFASVKVGIVHCMVLFLYFNKKHTQLITKLINFVLAVYIGICLLHIYFGIQLF